MAFNTTDLIRHLINLDFKQSSFCSIPVEQYDKDSAYIEAELFDGGSPYTIPVGSTASFGGTKPSSHIILETAIIENNKVYYKISEQCTVKEGDYPVKFTLYLPNDAVKYTQEFKIKVRKAVISSDAIADVDEVDVLNGLIVDASGVISNANTATTNAIDATNSANNAAELANIKAGLADEKANDANNAAILANEKAGLADTATSNANIATTNANTATTDAINATSNANIATTNAQNAADHANDIATILDNETLKIFKPAVSTYTDLSIAYPTPENGWTVTVTDEVVSYRYNGTEWINLGVISSVDIATDTKTGIVKGGSDVHIAIDGAMSVPDKLDKIGDTKDNVTTFTEAEADEDIATGEKHSTIFGKLLKSIKTIRYNIGLLATEKIDKNSIVNTDTINDTTKVPSTAVTYALGQEVDTINNNFTDKTNKKYNIKLKNINNRPYISFKEVV